MQRAGESSLRFGRDLHACKTVFLGSWALAEQFVATSRGSFAQQSSGVAELVGGCERGGGRVGRVVLRNN